MVGPWLPRNHLRRSCLEPAYRPDDLEARLERLHLHWVTFDALFDGTGDA